MGLWSHLRPRTKSAPPVPEPRACPYCLYRFPQPPRHDTTCPACGEQIQVLLDRETGGRLLLTRDQAEELRAEDERAHRGQVRAHELDERCRRWLAELEESHGVLPEDLERERAGAPDASPEQLIARLLERLLELKRDHAELADLRERRARFLAEQGQPCQGELRQARALELLALQRAGCARVRIVDGGCPSCAALGGAVVDVEQALHTLPLPRSDCQRRVGPAGQQLCACRYSAVP
jgi:hypothetical protein